MKNYFVFFPEGFEKKDVDLVVNIRSVFRKKITAALCHKTQKRCTSGHSKVANFSQRRMVFVTTRTSFAFL